VKEDFDDFVPERFKDKLLDRDHSFESEEESLLKKLEEEESKEFYNMVRSIFSSANISLKDEELYSPLLEALIKNYSKRNIKDKHVASPKEHTQKVTSRINTLKEPTPVRKYNHIQAQLLDFKSIKTLTDG
jgi:hypothetical protein